MFVAIGKDSYALLVAKSTVYSVPCSLLFVSVGDMVSIVNVDVRSIQLRFLSPGITGVHFSAPPLC